MTKLQGSKADVLSNDYEVRAGKVAYSDAASGTQGVPSYTTTQRDALTGMVAGDLIVNTTTNKLNFYTGSAWEEITSA